MKRFTSTRLFAIVCMIVMGFVQTWAQTVNKPTINPGTKDSEGNYTCDFDGSIEATITADAGCTIIYKWGSTASTSEALQKSASATHVDNNVATTTKHYTNSRVLSAIAVKTENGTTTYSEATIAKFNYVADAKKTLTLTASNFKVNIGATQQIEVTAKDGDTEVTGLTYTYESENPNIATVDANGVVKGIASGNCYITISFAGNSSYKDATTSINVGVNSNVTSYASGTVFTNIADVRHAGQLIPDGDKTTYTWIIKLDKNNPATVVGIFNVDDSSISEGKGSIFIVDNTGRGLWIPTNDTKNLNYIKDLKVGDKIIGTLVGVYKERKSTVPEFTNLTKTYESTKTDFKIDTTGETANDGNPLYPVNEITDVYTITNTNDPLGDIVKSSYGIYINTIVSVPGTIKLGADETYYLMQDETTNPNGNYDKRLAINTEQIGVNIADYVNTSGTFEGVLFKLSKNYAKLVVLKNNFFQINKIYLDENDDENRIDDLVNAGAFDDEVDVYVHRTKLVNPTANAWNTLCFPFDLSAEEFNTAFGCTLSALAKPKVNTEETVNGRLTKIGEVDSNNNLLFNTVEDLSIEEGMPYLMKAEGKQIYGINPSTNISIKDKTPQELIDAEPNYYAHIGQKMITVVPPHQIQGEINNKVVGGKFYLRGLYGSKQYANNADGSLSNETTVADNGSQKYQYISTSEHNYLKYLQKDATAKFPGFRAYFYFPNWSSEENNKAQANAATNTTNAKVFLLVDDSTTGISDIRTDESHNDGRIYNLAGQVVDESYKGIVIKNGRKYLAK